MHLFSGTLILILILILTVDFSARFQLQADHHLAHAYLEVPECLCLLQLETIGAVKVRLACCGEHFQRRHVQACAPMD